MTVFTIEADSEQETQMLLEYVKEHKLRTTTTDHRVLTDDDMVFGFGRAATSAELREYLEATEEDSEEDFVDIEDVRKEFSKKSATI